jgi:predicted nucleic acid-binding protein
LFAKPGLSSKEEYTLRDFLSDRIAIINLTAEIKRETIALRRTVKLKLPDCIIAATTIALNATLLTADNRLLRLNRPGYKALNLN